MQARRPTRLPSFAGLGAGLIALAQIVIEGYRWQMAPLYLFTGFAVVLSLRELRHPLQRQRSSRRRILGSTIYAFILILCMLLPELMPAPRLPLPTGPYSVGTTSFELIDSTRNEIYSDDPNEPRALLVQLWYPATPAAAADTVPWLEYTDRQIPIIAESAGLPAFMFSHMRQFFTHAYLDAPLVDAFPTYPILHFSHGYGGFRAQNTFLAEDLASHGYVVVSAEHPYAALNTLFPDGRVAKFNQDTLPEGVPDDIYAEAAQRLLRQWVEDTGFVQDTLEISPLPGPISQLEGRLDFGRMGTFGHSTGGGAALQFCAEDKRCKATVGLDAWLIPLSDTLLAEGLSKPTLFLFSDPDMAYFEPDNRQLLDLLVQHSSSTPLDYQIAGTGHHDFDDTATFSPIARYFGYNKGPIPAARAFEIIRVYTLAFFKQTLDQQPTALFDEPSLWYPEIQQNTK
ncbi:MAG: hypothetical protein GY759_04845 [Chloroflexi bacterium]|nr:hypothetical protein [Chloroflexota bacterium]